MTAPEPTQIGGSLASYTITANGTPIDTAWDVVSIDIWSGVNILPKARLTILDGNAADQTFPISETGTLVPGAKLTIALGYDGTAAPVFSGIVYRQGIEIASDGPPRLIVEATDPAMAMTLARRNAVFENATDSAVIAELIGNAGLIASVATTSPVEETIVQFHASDWDFMLLRAAVNGMVVTASGGTVTVAPPDTDQSPVLTLTYGTSILDFRADMDASTQYAAGAVQSIAWDPATQEIARSGTASASVTAPGNISSEKLAEVFGVTSLQQQTGATLGQDDLTTWSSARLAQSRLAKICGECRFQGSALAKAGSMMTLAGLGSRFNGNAYVSAVHHRVVAGEWTTIATIGLSPNWSGDAVAAAVAPAASGQIPAAANLQTGIVQAIDQDPGGEFRVQVSLPLLQAGNNVWARLASFYASDNAGAFFYPEVGDEVVVAFMNGDPRFPVIVGSLYSKRNPAPIPPDATNARKSIVSRSGLRIDLFETGGAIEISTPAGQSVRLDDQAGTVTIKDANRNVVTMAGSGVTVDSAASITLSAKTDIDITAAGNLSLKGASGIAIAGLTIDANAQTSFSATGTADAKLTSSGMVVIEGGMVKIN